MENVSQDDSLGFLIFMFNSIRIIFYLFFFSFDYIAEWETYNSPIARRTSLTVVGKTTLESESTLSFFFNPTDQKGSTVYDSVGSFLGIEATRRVKKKRKKLIIFFSFEFM